MSEFGARPSSGAFRDSGFGTRIVDLRFGIRDPGWGFEGFGFQDGGFGAEDRGLGDSVLTAWHAGHQLRSFGAIRGFGAIQVWEFGAIQVWKLGAIQG